MSKRGKRGEPGTFGPDVYDADSPDAKDRAAGGWGLGRRDFLKASGFFVAGASLGCARGPAPEAIALLEASPEMVPGRSSWYASTCGACSAACGVLVRSRDGRPLKLEGNPLHGLSRGGLCAVGQASLLELYDSQRLRRPLWRGGETTWEELDAEISRGLAGAAAKGLPVRLLTETMHSPSELAAIARFGEAFDDFRHVVYDPLSVSAILDAHAATHGRRVLPRYRFEAADVLVVTQKVFSKVEGRLVEVDADDPRGHAAVVDQESVRVLRRRGDLVISETAHGFVCANAGVDLSNVDRGWAALLPTDPDRSCRKLRDRLRAATGVEVAVVMSDTFGRPWRRGVTDVAIGCAGIAAVVDLRGTSDTFGRELQVTEVAVADEIAAAAELVMGKSHGIPAAIVRGVDRSWLGDGSVADEIVRDPAEDLFR